jgi:hypothetical protein
LLHQSLFSKKNLDVGNGKKCFLLSYEIFWKGFAFCFWENRGLPASATDAFFIDQQQQKINQTIFLRYQ